MKKQLSSSRYGRYVPISCGIGETQAFIPPFLPPNPPVDLASLQQALEEANQALGRLDGMAAILDPLFFNYVYVRKEALLSSKIAGTQSSLSELIAYEDRGAFAFFPGGARKKSPTTWTPFSMGWIASRGSSRFACG